MASAAVNATVLLNRGAGSEVEQDSIAELHAALATNSKRIDFEGTFGGRKVISQLIKHGIHMHGSSSEAYYRSYSTADIRRITRIQATYRGMRVRKEIAYSWPDAFEFTGKANGTVLEQIKVTYVGISKLLSHITVLVIFCLMVHFQLFAASPSDYSVEEPLVDMFQRVKVGEQGYSADHIDTVGEIYEYFRSVVVDLHSTDPYFDPPEECDELVQDYCASVSDGFYRSKNDLFGCLNVTKNSGYTGVHSRAFMALFLSQTRRKAVECTNTRGKNGEDIFNTYADAVGEGGSRSCVSDDIDDTFRSQFFEKYPDEYDTIINESILPHIEIFEPSETYMFPLLTGVFNGHLNISLCDIDNLENSQWIDERTKEVCGIFLISNVNQNGAVAISEACFNISLGGKIGFEHRSSTSHLFHISDQIEALVFFSIFCAITVVMAIHTSMLLVQLTQLLVQRVKTAKFFRALYSLLFYPSTHSFIMDIVVVSLFIKAIVMYVQLLVKGESYVPQQANMTRIFSKEGLPLYYEDLVLFKELSFETRAYKNICAGIFLVLIVQTIRLLNFHPDFGIVSRTLYQAANDLGHFVIVLVAILFFYAYVAVLLLGEDHEYYSTLGLAFNEMMFVAVGEMEDAKEAMFKENTDRGQSAIKAVFFWSFVFMVTLLLFNILLSVIIDAFVQVQEYNRHNRSFNFIVSLQVWFALVTCDIKKWNNRHFGCGNTTEVNAESGSILLKRLSLAPDIESKSVAATDWKKLCIHLDIDCFSNTMDWLRELKQKYKTHRTSSYILRYQLEQVFPVGVTEHIINVLRNNSTKDRIELENARNRIFKRRAGDISFSNYQMIKAVYANRLEGAQASALKRQESDRSGITFNSDNGSTNGKSFRTTII